MAMIDINWNPSTRELRQFAGIWFPGLFILVGGLVWHKTGSLSMAATIWSVAFVVSLLGYLIPPFMRLIFVGWMVAAFPIGWTISHVMLAVIFYLVLTPIGLLMRMFGYDAVQRQLDRSAKTYWVPHNPGGDTKRYFKQF
jgi:hypothetical protein